MTALVVTGSLIAAFVGGWIIGGVTVILVADVYRRRTVTRPFRPDSYWGA